MTNRERVRWITRTGVMIALLVALQWATAGTQVFAGQYITGSAVNCVLAVATWIGGLYSGAVVALLSPFCAYLLGIGPKLLQIVPAISLGNLVFVILLHVLAAGNKLPVWRRGVAVAAAAAGKFAMLYLAVVVVLIPAMGATLPEKQAATFTVMFSWPQLITALIGGTVAMLIAPLLKKALKQ